jgi:hypothetical protein
MEKIINRLIDEAVVNVDKYVNNGSTWLIFTESKQWVIELTKDGTLWYNYNFFNNLFVYTSMDVIENQHYITKWVEDNIINGVKHTDSLEWKCGFYIEDTIQNGVKRTLDGNPHPNHQSNEVEDIIQNGIKHTEYGDWEDGDERLDDIIQNGVKHIETGGYLGSIEMKGKIVHQLESPKQNNEVEDVIQHGVIETFDETHHRRREVVRTIRDGIKQTCAQIPSIDAVVERVVEEGIKETHDDVYHHTARVEGVIRNGIKEVKGLPDMSGELRGYGDYYRSQKTMAKPHSLYVKDVIENGIKETIL